MRSLMRSLVALALVAAAAGSARAQPVVSPHIGAKVAGDVETERGGIGVSLGYVLPHRFGPGLGLGLELDATWHGHFFRDEELTDLVPDGVDLNTDALILTGNLVMPLRIARAPIWLPYATAGLGMTHAIFDAQGADQYDRSQNDLTVNAGVGVMHRLTRLVGLRVDARYYRALVDADASSGGYFEDYAFWNIAVGVTFGFPAPLPAASR
jgi:opacity protein-like surface antigen